MKRIILIFMFFLAMENCFGNVEIKLKDYDVFLLDNGQKLDLIAKKRISYFKKIDDGFYDPNEVGNTEMILAGFISNIYDYSSEKTEYYFVKFDKKGNFIKSRINDLYGTITFSPGGLFYIQNTYSKGVFLKQIEIPDFKEYIDDNKISGKIIFFRYENYFVYRKEDGSVFIFNLETKEKRFLIKIDFPVDFGDISYDNKLLLMTDHSRILTLNLETGEIKVITEYKPTIFSYQERFYEKGHVAWTRPDIVQSSFSWREDGKGFIFTRYPENANFLWLGFGGKLAPPALYYYDLEENKEYLITEDGTRGKIGIRKKAKE